MPKPSYHQKINRACQILGCSVRKLFDIGYRLAHGKIDPRTVGRAYGRFRTGGPLANFVRRLVTDDKRLKRAKRLVAQTT